MLPAASKAAGAFGKIAHRFSLPVGDANPHAMARWSITAILSIRSTVHYDLKALRGTP
jgi:uncharacterized protein with PIN domain